MGGTSSGNRDPTSSPTSLQCIYKIIIIFDNEDTAIQDSRTSLRFWQTDHHHPQS